jgi:hypothetical protein
VAAAPPLMNALLAAIPSSLAFVLVAMPMVAGGILVLLPAGRSRAEMESNAQNGGNP